MPSAAPPSARPPRARGAAAITDHKRSFLRMVSHELRTPLNSILGFSEILSSELYGPLGSPQYKEYAEIVRDSGQKLLKLVNQVLEIARLEAGAVEFDMRPEPLDTALEEALAGLKEDLAGRDVRVTAVGPMPAVIADSRGLHSVLTNLIQNAVIFSPDGGEVRVSARAVDRGVEILVEDDGQGVDPAELPRLLRPFEQGENALVRRGDGAGLGLTICELTCQAMGGRLRLESKPGKGLTARVVFKAV